MRPVPIDYSAVVVNDAAIKARGSEAGSGRNNDGKRDREKGVGALSVIQ